MPVIGFDVNLSEIFLDGGRAKGCGYSEVCGRDCNKVFGTKLMGARVRGKRDRVESICRIC